MHEMNNSGFEVAVLSHAVYANCCFFLRRPLGLGIVDTIIADASSGLRLKTTLLIIFVPAFISVPGVLTSNLVPVTR